MPCCGLCIVEHSLVTTSENVPTVSPLPKGLRVLKNKKVDFPELSDSLASFRSRTHPQEQKLIVGILGVNGIGKTLTTDVLIGASMCTSTDYKANNKNIDDRYKYPDGC